MEIDPETHERKKVDPAGALALIQENQEMFALLIDIEAGVVILTLQDYELLPAVFVDARRMFRQVKAELTHANT